MSINLQITHFHNQQSPQFYLSNLCWSIRRHTCSDWMCRSSGKSGLSCTPKSSRTQCRKSSLDRSMCMWPGRRCRRSRMRWDRRHRHYSDKDAGNSSGLCWKCMCWLRLRFRILLVGPRRSFPRLARNKDLEFKEEIIRGKGRSFSGS